MTSKLEVQAILSDFIAEFDGKCTIWGIAVGAGPGEYDEYGKTKHRSLVDFQDFALHVYVSDGAFRETIPGTYKGVPVIVFEDASEDPGHQWSSGDVKPL